MADEILKDAELDKVVGGSGMECIGFLFRLKTEGLYTPKTSLAPGNEAAAAKEIQEYLSQLPVKRQGGDWQKLAADIYPDGHENSYYRLSHRGCDGAELREPLSVDELVDLIKQWQR